MQKYLDTTIIDVKEIDKTFKSIWEFTYKISGGEEARARLVKRDPDHLLVRRHMLSILVSITV
jgi:hypothetical protein